MPNDISSEVIDDCMVLSQLFKYQLITLGSNGVLVVGKYSDSVHINHIPALFAGDIVNTNGAGDSFVGSCLALLSKTDFIQKNTLSEIPFTALCNISEKSRIASIMSLKSPSPVSELLTPDIYNESNTISN
ncbi:hypothetical protein BB561_006496 [Smittium simulii]|uniref:Carbohydrate kinase PfkB domain-containing protein n=1 Tax=Smittium simulii TaxID=133385 RepID=A0A2T9Y3S4_9FUNG|nr:hypothetical protein BB561_006496 [Smittium simulii]